MNIRTNHAAGHKIPVFLALLVLLCACGGTSSGKEYSVIIPEADGEETLTSGNLLIDISHLDLGYLMVLYTGSSEKLYVQLTGPDEKDYKYFMESSGEYTTIPLTEGDGSYYLCAYENVGGNQYSPILSQMLNVELASEFSPFLCSNQYVDFTMDSHAVKKAEELTEDMEEDLEKVQAVYDWVTGNITYDYEKAATVGTGYLPDVDETLESKTGICFDYAALMTAMLRSQGIPTKLNIGYLTEDVYHAWISVYLEETGWVDEIIRFNGEDWEMMDPTVAASGGTQEAETMAEDDNNYIVRYVR